MRLVIEDGKIEFGGKTLIEHINFDINNGVGIEDNLPWYDDLYLDVTMECNTITEIGNYIRLDDEIEFKKAKKEGVISDELYQRGYEVAIRLMT